MNFIICESWNCGPFSGADDLAVFRASLVSTGAFLLHFGVVYFVARILKSSKGFERWQPWSLALVLSAGPSAGFGLLMIGDTFPGLVANGGEFAIFYFATTGPLAISAFLWSRLVFAKMQGFGTRAGLAFGYLLSIPFLGALCLLFWVGYSSGMKQLAGFAPETYTGWRNRVWQIAIAVLTLIWLAIVVGAMRIDIVGAKLSPVTSLDFVSDVTLAFALHAPLCYLFARKLVFAFGFGKWQPWKLAFVLAAAQSLFWPVFASFGEAGVGRVGVIAILLVWIGSAILWDMLVITALPVSRGVGYIYIFLLPLPVFGALILIGWLGLSIGSREPTGFAYGSQSRRVYYLGYASLAVFCITMMILLK